MSSYITNSSNDLNFCIYEIVAEQANFDVYLDIHRSEFGIRLLTEFTKSFFWIDIGTFLQKS